MKVTTYLTGTQPLLMHNVHLANPDNEWASKIAQVTKRRKKTEDDRKEISRLEWYGGLYIDQEKIVVPTTNLLRCFNEAAKITKAGRQVTRALTPPNLVEPLIFPDSDMNLEDLRKKGNHVDVTSVGIGRQRVMRTRPIFRAWAVVTEWNLLTEVLDYDDFVSIVFKSGRVEGLGDNRTNGYGRFWASITDEDGVEVNNDPKKLLEVKAEVPRKARKAA